MTQEEAHPLDNRDEAEKDSDPWANVPKDKLEAIKANIALGLCGTCASYNSVNNVPVGGDKGITTAATTFSSSQFSFGSENPLHITSALKSAMWGRGWNLLLVNEKKAATEKKKDEKVKEKDKEVKEKDEEVKKKNAARTTIFRVRFMPTALYGIPFNWSQPQREKVKTYASQWFEGVNARFEFLEDADVGDSDIRVTRCPFKVSITDLGTRSRMTPQSDATMNLAFDDGTPEVTVRMDVLHEFGHALGLVHEHQSPEPSNIINKEELRKHYAPRGWTDADILPEGGRGDHVSSQFDPDSIMIYEIPGSAVPDGQKIERKTVLSAGDKAFMIRLFGAAPARADKK